MSELFTTEEIEVKKTIKRYTCTECGHKLDNGISAIKKHCAEHRLEVAVKDVSYTLEGRVLINTTDGIQAVYPISAIFKSEEQADDFCSLLCLTADTYSPILAEIAMWEGQGKYVALGRLTGNDFGETLQSYIFKKEKE